jgi:hypothetical protein
MEQIAESPPSAVRYAVDRIIDSALAAGWPSLQSAFEAAMLMIVHGTSTDEAERMFANCWRRMQ